MMAVSHVVFGATSWAVVSHFTGSGPLDPLDIGAAALGALLPDIDHPKSAMGRRLSLISVPLAALVGHRGVTHSLLAVAVAAAILFFLVGRW